MNIARYDQNYRPLSLLDRLLNQDLESRQSSPYSREADVVTDWLPSVDIQETDDSFVLKADLPGVEPDKIDVSMEDGILTIQGSRDSETSEKKQGYQRFERVTGKFLRRFTLPDTANGERISAATRDGVLEVSIPKQERIKPRKIDVVSA